MKRLPCKVRNSDIMSYRCGNISTQKLSVELKTVRLLGLKFGSYDYMGEAMCHYS